MGGAWGVCGGAFFNDARHPPAASSPAPEPIPSRRRRNPRPRTRRVRYICLGRSVPCRPRAGSIIREEPQGLLPGEPPASSLTRGYYWFTAAVVQALIAMACGSAGHVCSNGPPTLVRPITRKQKNQATINVDWWYYRSFSTTVWYFSIQRMIFIQTNLAINYTPLIFSTDKLYNGWRLQKLTENASIHLSLI